MKIIHSLLLRGMLWLVLVTVGSGAQASELVYTPVNPSFGGSPLNGQWLLGYAGAQNKFKNGGYGASGREEKPFGLKIAEEVTRRTVRRIENELLDALFDDRLSSADISDSYGASSGDALIYIEVNQYGDGNTSSIDIGY